MLNQKLIVPLNDKYRIISMNIDGYKRAKKIIPGGNMLLSKRPEMFLPEKWPTYYSKSKGCKVWDLDGNEYIDMSIMGIGTNILGYGHPEVDEAVSITNHFPEKSDSLTSSLLSRSVKVKSLNCSPAAGPMNMSKL